MWDMLKPFIARFVGGIAASLASWLSIKYGITLEPETTQGVVAVGVGVAFIVYSIVHRLVSKKTDPADKATTPV